MTPHPPLARSPFSHRRRLFICSTFSCIGFVPSSRRTLCDSVFSQSSIFSGVLFSANAKNFSSCSYISPPGSTLYPNLSIALCLILFIRTSRGTSWFHYTTNRQRKQVLCRFYVCIKDRRGRRSLQFCKHPYEKAPKARGFLFNLSKDRKAFFRDLQGIFLLSDNARCPYSLPALFHYHSADRYGLPAVS